MKTLIALFFASVAILSSAQAQRVVHHSYVTYYNVEKMEPDSVVWNLTPEMLDGMHSLRKDKFAKDPSILQCVGPSAYTNSGLDKGHMFPHADAEFNSIDRVECFYMSNMLPQYHGLNAGDWKTLEEQERSWGKLARIHILAGGIGSIGKTPGGVNIPAKCWKAIFVSQQWHCFVMTNSPFSKGHQPDFWQVSKDELNRQIGLHL